ncbi:MAG: hypothetical protein L0271_10310 [Gemmatimonadetes bacterium]|nr:hypothetical protein [Gemmatimonadota bacterium]
MSLRLLLALLVLIADAWAISRVLDSGLPTRAKLRWTLAIIALPVIGIVWCWRATAGKPGLPVPR